MKGDEAGFPLQESASATAYPRPPRFFSRPRSKILAETSARDDVFAPSARRFVETRGSGSRARRCALSGRNGLPLPRSSALLDTTALVGYVATTCTTLAFIPQVVRTWRTRKADDLSLGTLTVLLSGTVLWIVYGAKLMGGGGPGLPIVLGNVVTLVLLALNTALVLRFRTPR